MVRDKPHVLYIGIYNSVVALDTRDGAELWRAKLGGYAFVTVHWDGEELFAAAKGEVFKLDPRSGDIIWNAGLEGLRTGSATLVSTRAPSAHDDQVVAAEVRRQQASRQAAT